MTVLLIIFGVLAAIFAGAVALFTLGPIAAALIVVLVIAAVVVAIRLAGTTARTVTIALGVVALAAIGFAGWSGFVLTRALTDRDGPADPPDPVAFASADAKIQGAKETAGFRLEFSGEEATALAQDAMAGGDNSPIKSITLTIVDREGGTGYVDFEGEFKSGSTTLEGQISASVDAGRLNIELDEVGLANLNLPGFARGGLEDLIEAVTDLNKKLEENGADIQSVFIGNGMVVITGTTVGGELITLDTVFEGVRENVLALENAATPPPESLGPGAINSTQSDGPSYYVAIGDSLAPNVGVASARDGYVSRFHNQLQLRDGAEYGLRNFGVSGESSGTLIRLGQLDAAIDFMEDNDVSYVSIDIGANDLLGHIYSPECSESFSDPACQERLSIVTAAYTSNIGDILERIEDAAPDATIIFLTSYNPFSFGLPNSEFEAVTNAAVDALNDVAAAAAEERGMVVADGFGALAGTTAGTTHMTDPDPDIHPKAIGYDLLAAALLAALR